MSGSPKFPSLPAASTLHTQPDPLDPSALMRKAEAASVAGCLRAHDITPSKRARMVSWMLEVFATYECEEETFFSAVTLMDMYHLRNRRYVWRFRR